MRATTKVSRVRTRLAAVVTATAVLAVSPVGATESAPHAPSAVVGPPVPVELAAGNEPSFDVAAVLPPTALRPWLMVGAYRSAPGAVNQLVAYTASPGQDWAMVAFSGESGPDVEVVGAANTADGGAVVFGSVDTDDGRRPATWLFDGTTLQPAAVVGDPSVPGTVTAGTVSADGVWYVVVERREKSGAVWSEVAALRPGGSWTATRLPTGTAHLRAKGIAARGTTVVVTGDARDPEQRSAYYEASGYVSDDGGITFTETDTRLMTGSGPTALGPVVAHTDGTFYAASCTGRGDSYATSVDGHDWEIHPDPDPGMSKGGCLAVAVDEGGGVWVVRFLGDLFAVRLVDDEPVQVVVLPHDQRAFFTAQYLDKDDYAVAVDATHVGFVGAQHGGVRGGFGSRDDEVNFAQLAMGTPSGHPAFRNFTVVDEAGSLVHVDTFPIATEHESGGWFEGPRSELRDVTGSGQLTASAALLPIGAHPDETTELLVDTPTGQIAFGSLQPVDPDERSGSIGDLGIARRSAGQPWPPLVPELTGPGSPWIAAAAVEGSRVFAVGGEAQGGWLSPLVGVDDGTTFRRLRTPPTGLVDGLTGVCRLPNGRYVVVGGRDDRRPFSMVLNVGTENLTPTDAVIDNAVTGFVDCAAAKDGVVVVAETVGGPSIFTTTDGTTFTPLPGFDPLAVGVSVDSGPNGIAMTGRAGVTGGDGFLAYGPTIAELAVVDAPTMRGPGAHEPMVVIVRENEVLVLGTINGRPVVWPVSLTAG